MTKTVFVAEAVHCDHSVILGAWPTFKELVSGIEEGVRINQISEIDREIAIYMLPLGIIQERGWVARLHFEKGSHKARIEWINGHTLEEVSSGMVVVLWCPDCGAHQTENEPCNICGGKVQRPPTEDAGRKVR